MKGKKLGFAAKTAGKKIPNGLIVNRKVPSANVVIGTYMTVLI